MAKVEEMISAGLNLPVKMNHVIIEQGKRKKEMR